MLTLSLVNKSHICHFVIKTTLHILYIPFIYLGVSPVRTAHLRLFHQTHGLFRQRINPLLHHHRGSRWRRRAPLKLCGETKVSVHAKEVWADEKSHLESDEWNVEGRRGEEEWKCWLQAWGKITSALGLCLVFNSALPEEEVHGSPGQSRFYLPSYFVAASPLVTLLPGLFQTAQSLRCPKHKSDMTETCSHSFEEEVLRANNTDTWHCGDFSSLHLVYSV